VTIINSIVSDHGLIQASDSNLTSLYSSNAVPGPKVFRLGFADGALAVAGVYSVGTGTQTMETWMPSCISDYASTDSSPTQEGFANYLKERLNTDLTPHQKTIATIIQIVGYVSDDDGVHPALHVVRNDSSINPSTGAYQGIRPTFEKLEDFWGRDYPEAKKAGALGPGWYQSYFNGTPEGRIAFYEFGQQFQRFLSAVWSQPNWKFRPPQSLDELASIVELQIRTIGTLYGISGYPAPFIGGDPQILKIAPPSGAARLA
jgi:hypothetical protein